MEIDTRSGAEIGLIGACYPWGSAIDPSGSTAYVALEGCSSLLVVSLPSLNQVADVTLPGNGGSIGVAVNPVMPYVYVAQGIFDYRLQVVSTKTLAVVASIQMPTGTGGPYGVAVSNDGNSVYATTNGGDLVEVDANRNQILSTIRLGYIPQAVAITPDGSRVYVTEQDNTVQVISTATQSIIHTIPVGNNPGGISIDPTGSYVYVTDIDSGQASVIATSTDMVVATFPLAGRPCGFGDFIRPPLSTGAASRASTLRRPTRSNPGQPAPTSGFL